MSRDRFDVLERFEPLFEVPEPSFERFVHRRDRRRRNQRVTSRVVGFAVFVAAIWIVTTVGSLDRTQTPAVPGAETGPTVTEPTAPHEGGWDGFGVPPEGAVPSTPEEGRLVARYSAIHVGEVFVYADGRVIWLPDGGWPILNSGSHPRASSSCGPRS
jgi:hypothetical protein